MVLACSNGVLTVLALNSLQWKELEHAYGSAANIPALIEALHTAPPYKPGDWQTEPWFSLWSSLCHQNDVYTASYAAVPHFVAIAATKPLQERLEFIHLVAWIEVCRHLPRAGPPYHEQAYRDALEHAAGVAVECLEIPWNEVGLRILLGALAVFRGQAQFGAWVMDPPEECQCPKCGSLFPTPPHNLFQGHNGFPDTLPE